nr:hypothetical protein [Tanacetum cinerariifolium]
IFVGLVNLDMLILGINNRLFSISEMIYELHYVFCKPNDCKNASVGNVVSFISVKRRNFCVSEGRAIGGVACSQASVNGNLITQVVRTEAQTPTSHWYFIHLECEFSWNLHVSEWFRSYKEDSEEYGNPNFLSIAIVDTIKSRTEALLKKTKTGVSSMVKSLASPPHRILVFLQQSSVEWCSSLWLDVICDIHPTFRRTLIVVSKFDNRLKEFTEK